MDYPQLAPSMPCKLEPTTTLSQLAIGNVIDLPDAAGLRREVILVPGQGTNTNTLSLISYFDYGEISSEWPLSFAMQLATVFTCVGNISNDDGSFVPLSATNQYYVADINGDERDEIITWDPITGTLAVAGWDNKAIASLWSSPPEPFDPA